MSQISNNDDLVDTLDCIGIDDRIHHCIPWKDRTICDVEVKRKNVTGADRVSKFNCWECDAHQDEKDIVNEQLNNNLPVDPCI